MNRLYRAAQGNPARQGRILQSASRMIGAISRLNADNARRGANVNTKYTVRQRKGVASALGGGK